MIIMVDRLADAINIIKTNERVGREECVIPSNKLIKTVVEVLKNNNYIEGYEEFSERYQKKLKIKLANKINKISVVKPRFSIAKDNITKYESRYIPSKDFGILVISTPKGILTNREVRAQNIGGSLIMYVY